MSLLSFTKCFIGAGGEQAATALTTAMVKMAPETATAAELKNMEQDLDAAGQLISRLQRELADERHAYNSINARYTQMMGAAENLQHQIDTASFLKDPLQASLATLGRADRRNGPRTRPGQEGTRLRMIGSFGVSQQGLGRNRYRQEQVAVFTADLIYASLREMCFSAEQGRLKVAVGEGQ